MILLNDIVSWIFISYRNFIKFVVGFAIRNRNRKIKGAWGIVIAFDQIACMLRSNTKAIFLISIRIMELDGDLPNWTFIDSQRNAPALTCNEYSRISGFHRTKESLINNAHVWKLQVLFYLEKSIDWYLLPIRFSWKNCAFVSKHLHVNSVKWQSYKDRLPWFLNSSKLCLYIKMDIYLSAVLKLYQCLMSAIVFFYHPKKSMKFMIKMIFLFLAIISSRRLKSFFIFLFRITNIIRGRRSG